MICSAPGPGVGVGVAAGVGVGVGVEVGVGVGCGVLVGRGVDVGRGVPRSCELVPDVPDDPGDVDPAITVATLMVVNAAMASALPNNGRRFILGLLELAWTSDSRKYVASRGPDFRKTARGEVMALISHHRATRSHRRRSGRSDRRIEEGRKERA